MSAPQVAQRLDEIGSRAARWLAALIVVAGVALIARAFMGCPGGGVELAALPDDPRVVLSYAGAFPGVGDDKLLGPSGVVIDDTRVYVAESETGRIVRYDLAGRRCGRYTVPVAEGAPSAAPTSIATVSRGTLAVVDSASSRVLVLALSGRDRVDVVLEIGSAETTLQPTAVTFHRGLYYVADGASHTIRVYDDAGLYVRSLGEDVDPALSYQGGLAVYGGRLVLTDGNTGRVIALPLSGDGPPELLTDLYDLPRGVAEVGDGLGVVDVLGRAVRVCDAEGRCFRTLDEVSVPDGRLLAPESVAWHRRPSRLYVTDPVRGQVVVFNVRL